MRRARPISSMSDAQLVRRYQELYVLLIECAIDPEHPTSKMNVARWKRERRQVESACEQRGLFKEAP